MQIAVLEMLGASFALSLANFFMGHWEERAIWNNNTYAKNMIFYGRYIDDFIIIWEGDELTLAVFFQYCNKNDLGIEFTMVQDREKLLFLDLELSHEDGEIHSKTHFKPTAGNSYVHRKSCHLSRWKDKISQSRFRRLKGNCSKIEDYMEQGTLLGEKYLVIKKELSLGIWGYIIL